MFTKIIVFHDIVQYGYETIINILNNKKKFQKIKIKETEKCSSWNSR